jgi:hypothetical protein
MLMTWEDGKGPQGTSSLIYDDSYLLPDTRLAFDDTIVIWCRASDGYNLRLGNIAIQGKKIARKIIIDEYDKCDSTGTVTKGLVTRVDALSAGCSGWTFSADMFIAEAPSRQHADGHVIHSRDDTSVHASCHFYFERRV